MNRGFKGNDARQDLKSKAIWMANDHIQTGDMSILSSSKDYPLSDDSIDFDISDSNLPSFEQGWQRRLGRNKTASMYSETYIGIFGVHICQLNPPKMTMAQQNRRTDQQTYPCEIFDVGINFGRLLELLPDGPQVEEVCNVLLVKYPNFNFLLMFDQSSSYGKMREVSLNVHTMSLRFGGKEQILRGTIIEEIGPHPSILELGNEQKMVFDNDNSRPFYLNNNH